ncbi:MAG: class I SAM-dependent methyltransferase, partial [Alphaproteobacteria bacterium]|nr:class I SAM-dependent methyltransferase [Alphaproteobacteria bacterium]
MHLDVGDLQSFYDGPMGRISRRLIRERLREVWPNVRGLSVLGLGFATPYLQPFQGEAERTIAIMPAQQGVTAWPGQAANVVALADETTLPLPDASFDRVIVAHILENTEALRPFLRQIWRILTPAGRMVVIAPNRTSLWAQIETTPFAHGRPFSRGQLERLLVDAMFTPTASTTCLHMPPFGASMLVRDGARWERWGRKMWPRLAGIHLTEATKEVMALAPDRGLRQRVPAKPVLARPSSRVTRLKRIRVGDSASP